MLRRHMATKKKDMPKDLDSGTPALDDDDLVDDDPEVDDLEADIDEDALVDIDDDDPLDDDDDIVEIDDDDDDEVGVEVVEILTAAPRQWSSGPARPTTTRRRRSPRTRTSKPASTSF